MGFILSFLFFLFFFVSGMLGGFIIGAELGLLATTDAGNSAMICEGCDCPIAPSDAVFCETCVDDNEKDSLNNAIKEKELDIRYVNVALRQRNLVNKPEKVELQKLRGECTKVKELCEKVRTVAEELDLKVNIEPLKERNESLEACLDKWQSISDREEKIDDIISKQDLIF